MTSHRLGQASWLALEGDTLLMAIPQTDTIGPRQIELVRILLQRGADVNKVVEPRTAGFTLLPRLFVPS